MADYDAEREASSTQVTDWSGNARHATQSDNTKRPVRSATGFGTNSKAYWQGIAGSFWLPPASILSGSLHVFAVLQASGVSSGGIHRLGGSGSSSETPFASAIYDDAGSTTRNQSSDIGTTFNATPVVYSVVSRAGEHTFKRGATVIFTTATNTVSFVAQPVLMAGGLYSAGTNVSSSYFMGKLARYLVFSAKLSTTDEAAVIARLNAIYGTS